MDINFDVSNEQKRKKKNVQMEMDPLALYLKQISRYKLLSPAEELQISGKIQELKKQIIDIYDLKDISFEEMKLNNFDKTRAFIKIQDGCNNFCSYCIIPYTRGNVRSKNPKEVLDEINKLIDNGHDEVVLTGIHTGHYGSEFENYNFGNLLSDILKIKKLKRLRISSIEITEITDEILEIIKN